MVITKKQVLQKIDKSKFLTQKGSFAFRVCKLIKDGEFDGVLSSSQLTDLLNGESVWGGDAFFLCLLLGAIGGLIYLIWYYDQESEE